MNDQELFEERDLTRFTTYAFRDEDGLWFTTNEGQKDEPRSASQTQNAVKIIQRFTAWVNSQVER